LLVSLLSVCGSGKGVVGNDVYYDGTIKVTTKGATASGDTFDESTTITKFKIEPWNVIPGNSWGGYDSVGTGCYAEVKVNDRLGEITKTFGPGRVPYDAGQMISLSISKTDKGYKYSLQVALPTPPIDPPIFPSCVLGMLGETLGDDYLPLEISGKATKNPFDGVSATMTWILNRHITK